MKKLYNKLLAVILIIAPLLLINQFASGQSSEQLCKDSYNRALGFYNKGQFARINNDLATCVSPFNIKGVLCKNEPCKSIIFKVYKLMISSYEKLKQSGLALKKKYELYTFYRNILTTQQIEATLASTKLEIIK